MTLRFFVSAPFRAFKHSPHYLFCIEIPVLLVLLNVSWTFWQAVCKS